MKNIFGLDIACGEYCGKEFIIRRADCKITEYQEKMIVQTVKVEKHKKFPLWLTVMQYLCAFTVILIVFTSLMDMERLTFAQMFAAAMWKYIIAIIAALGWLAILIASQINDRMAEKAPAFKDVYKVIEEEVYDKSYEKLSIPADAGVIEALSCSENIRGSKKPVKSPLYFGVELRIFTENGNLCLSDLETVMAVPLSDIKEVVKLTRTFKTGNWTKKEEYNSETFKRYSVRRNRAGEYFIRGGYSVRITHVEEDYEFILPCYDGKTLKKYINFDLEESLF